MNLHDNSIPLNLSETARTRLIAEIASVLRSNQVPGEARAAGLTLIGWLARRRPDEAEAAAPRTPDA